MENWKKISLRAAGFGAGFAVIAAVIVVGVLWWSSRPPKPKPWNDKAITALYESLDTEGDANTFRFVYTLQNNTDADYRIETDSGVHLATFLKRSQALSFSDTQNLHTDFPIYIPAKSRVRLQIHLNYPYPVKPNYQASDDEQHDFDTKVAQYVTKELGNVDGFVLLDEGSKDKIVMPNGWAERAKMPMKTKADLGNTTSQPVSKSDGMSPDRGKPWERYAACAQATKLVPVCREKRIAIDAADAAAGGWTLVGPLPSIGALPKGYNLAPGDANCRMVYEWDSYCRKEGMSEDWFAEHAPRSAK